MFQVFKLSDPTPDDILTYSSKATPLKLPPTVPPSSCLPETVGDISHRATLLLAQASDSCKLFVSKGQVRTCSTT